MIKASGIQGKYLEYKGLPLVRQGNEIYYGDMSDKYYLFLFIMEYKKDTTLNIDLPTKVMVQICASADGKVEKNTIYNHYGVEEIYFPKGTKRIESYAIENCPKLKRVYVPTDAVVDEQALYKTPENVEIVRGEPNGIKNILMD